MVTNKKSKPECLVWNMNLTWWMSTIYCYAWPDVDTKGRGGGGGYFLWEETGLRAPVANP